LSVSKPRNKAKLRSYHKKKIFECEGRYSLRSQTNLRLRKYRPSMSHFLPTLSNWQSTPLQGCCRGAHGSPFQPKRSGSPKEFFNTCNAL